MKEKDDGIKRKDSCVEELNTNQQQIEKKGANEDFVAKIEGLKLTSKILFGETDILNSGADEVRWKAPEEEEQAWISSKMFRCRKMLQPSTKCVPSCFCHSFHGADICCRRVCAFPLEHFCRLCFADI